MSYCSCHIVYVSGSLQIDLPIKLQINFADCALCLSFCMTNALYIDLFFDTNATPCHYVCAVVLCP